MIDRTVTEEFLNEPFGFSDDVYMFEKLKMFHDSPKDIHGITEDSPLRALHDAERATMNMRFELQDELVRRLYRLFIQAAEIGDGKYPIAHAMYSRLMEANFPIDVKMTKTIFCQKNFYKWRCLDVYVYEPDDEFYDLEEDWGEGEPYLEITVPTHSYEDDGCLQFSIPWRWLKTDFLKDHDSMLSDAAFTVAWNRAKVKYDYDQLFDYGGHDSPWNAEAMAKILLLIEDSPVMEMFKKIRAHETLKEKGEVKNA